MWWLTVGWDRPRWVVMSQAQHPQALGVRQGLEDGGAGLGVHGFILLLS